MFSGGSTSTHNHYQKVRLGGLQRVVELLEAAAEGKCPEGLVGEGCLGGLGFFSLMFYFVGYFRGFYIYIYV